MARAVSPFNGRKGQSALAQLGTARRPLSTGDILAAQSEMQGFVDRLQALVQASGFEWEEGGAPIDAARTILGWLRPAGT
jgi:hypothetical protein